MIRSLVSLALWNSDIIRDKYVLTIGVLLVSQLSLLVSCVDVESQQESEDYPILDEIFLGFRFGDSKEMAEDKIFLLLDEGRIKYQENPNRWFRGKVYTYEFLPLEDDYHFHTGMLSSPIEGIASIHLHFDNDTLYWIHLSITPSKHVVSDHTMEGLYDQIISLYREKYGWQYEYSREDWLWSKLDETSNRDWSDIHHKNVWVFQDEKQIEIENHTLTKYPRYLWDESQQWININYFDNNVKSKVDSVSKELRLKSKQEEAVKNRIEKEELRKKQLNDI